MLLHKVICCACLYLNLSVVDRGSWSFVPVLFPWEVILPYGSATQFIVSVLLLILQLELFLKRRIGLLFFQLSIMILQMKHQFICKNCSILHFPHSQVRHPLLDYMVIAVTTLLCISVRLLFTCIFFGLSYYVLIIGYINPFRKVTDIV